MPKASSVVVLQLVLASAEEIKNLSEMMTWDLFLSELKEGKIHEIVAPVPKENVVDCCSSSPMNESVLETDKKKRFAAKSWEALKKFRAAYRPLGASGTRLTGPGTKYCVTRQWPLSKEQVDCIDEFFDERAKAEDVRESKSPHCSPTFCVRKATGGWRVNHAYNKLNTATIPAKMQIPRKGFLFDSMGKSTIVSALDLKDSYYQVLMRDTDVAKTAICTPSGLM
uniref:Reverse transcriptase domain-containing protein n=1 Tax=Peronospora matthiolae TaxID=2874970 RepID=A0AAV1V5G8_9STRA